MTEQGLLLQNSGDNSAHRCIYAVDQEAKQILSYARFNLQFDWCNRRILVQTTLSLSLSKITKPMTQLFLRRLLMEFLNGQVWLSNDVTSVEWIWMQKGNDGYWRARDFLTTQSQVTGKSTLAEDDKYDKLDEIGKENQLKYEGRINQWDNSMMHYHEGTLDFIGLVKITTDDWGVELL